MAVLVKIELTLPIVRAGGLGLGFGLLIGWLVARRRTHEAEVRLGDRRGIAQVGCDVAAERDQALDMALQPLAQRLRLGGRPGAALATTKCSCSSRARPWASSRKSRSAASPSARRPLNPCSRPCARRCNEDAREIARIEKERGRALAPCAVRSKASRWAGHRCSAKPATSSRALRRPRCAASGANDAASTGGAGRHVERCDFFEQVHRRAKTARCAPT